MIGWIVIAMLVVAGLFILKMNHFKHRTWVVLLVLLALFLYISISLVNSNYDLNFDSTEGASYSIRVYFGWLANGFQNLKTLTGNAIKLDWTAANETLLDKDLYIPGRK